MRASPLHVKKPQEWFNTSKPLGLAHFLGFKHTKKSLFGCIHVLLKIKGRQLERCILMNSSRIPSSIGTLLVFLQFIHQTNDLKKF